MVVILQILPLCMYCLDCGETIPGTQVEAVQAVRCAGVKGTWAAPGRNARRRHLLS